MITNAPAGTPADAAKTIWDLADGFGLLIRLQAARGMTAAEARGLDEVCERLAGTAERLGKEALLENLQSARGRLQEMIP